MGEGLVLGEHSSSTLHKLSAEPALWSQPCCAMRGEAGTQCAAMHTARAGSPGGPARSAHLLQACCVGKLSLKQAEGERCSGRPVGPRSPAQACLAAASSPMQMVRWRRTAARRSRCGTSGRASQKRCGTGVGAPSLLYPPAAPTCLALHAHARACTRAGAAWLPAAEGRRAPVLLCSACDTGAGIRLLAALPLAAMPGALQVCHVCPACSTCPLVPSRLLHPPPHHHPEHAPAPVGISTTVQLPCPACPAPATPSQQAQSTSMTCPCPSMPCTNWWRTCAAAWQLPSRGRRRQLEARTAAATAAAAAAAARMGRPFGWRAMATWEMATSTSTSLVGRARAADAAPGPDRGVGTVASRCCWLPVAAPAQERLQSRESGLAAPLPGPAWHAAPAYDEALRHQIEPFVYEWTAQVGHGCLDCSHGRPSRGPFGSRGPAGLATSASRALSPAWAPPDRNIRPAGTPPRRPLRSRPAGTPPPPTPALHCSTAAA